jgi:hypothetical protein
MNPISVWPFVQLLVIQSASYPIQQKLKSLSLVKTEKKEKERKTFSCFIFLANLAFLIFIFQPTTGIKKNLRHLTINSSFEEIK